MGIRVRSAYCAAGILLAALAGGCTATTLSSTEAGLSGDAAPRLPAGVAAEPAAGAQAQQIAAPEAVRPGAEQDSYYVEFRARAGPVFHTYMVYGPVDPAGRPLEENFVGFHPKGGALGLAVGSAPLPVPGQLEKVWSDKHLPVLARYRASLSGEQYRNMVAFIEQERRKTKYWNLWVYNCNSFATEVAHAAGLQAPEFPAVIPPLYIAGLTAMNEGTPMPSMTAASATSWAPPRIRNDRPSFND